VQGELDTEGRRGRLDGGGGGVFFASDIDATLLLTTLCLRELECGRRGVGEATMERVAIR
jgi:hypothetical protein